MQVSERVSELASAFALSPAGALQADQLHRIAHSRRGLSGVRESRREHTVRQLSDREELAAAASHRSTSTEPTGEAAGGGSKAAERVRFDETLN